MSRMEIAKVGRWTYALTWYPHDGDQAWIGFEGPRVLGLRRAKRRAARHLRKLRRPPIVGAVRQDDERP